MPIHGKISDLDPTSQLVATTRQGDVGALGQLDDQESISQDGPPPFASGRTIRAAI
jgi:hypothetical protein